MNLTQLTLNNLSDDASLPMIFQFLGELHNACLKPAYPVSDASQFVIDSYERNRSSPPFFMWRFLNEDKERDEFIFNTIKNFGWGDEWVTDFHRNKWGLYPKRVRLVEKELRGLDEREEDISITTHSFQWLQNNDPEFGIRTNEEFQLFTKYFRKLAEEFLKNRSVW